MHFGLATSSIYLQMQRLLEGRLLLEEGAYFNVDIQRGGAY